MNQTQSEQIIQLQQQISQLTNKLAESQQQHSRCLNLLAAGESMRETLMIKAICAGVFNPPNPNMIN